LTLNRHFRRYQGRIAVFRKLCGLSQKQFADLFMTTARTVKRWESGRSDMTPHHEFFLTAFVGYVERNGVRDFRRRFVREEPRYGRVGRPGRAVQGKPQRHALPHEHEKTGVRPPRRRTACA
jgi:transcriptional regulator with XRE-family HTH domain